MLRQTWNTYRAWAKVARNAQAETQRWNLVALILVCVAAIFGVISSAVPASLSSLAAGVATVASAFGAYLGRQFVGTGKEAEWIQTRAVAEGIKSECYRYAAKSGPYAAVRSPGEAAKLLVARTDEISKQATAKGLVCKDDDPVPTEGDKREPPDDLTKEWYKINRISDQISFYKIGVERNQTAVNRLWWIAFVAGAAAVVFGALGAWAQRFAPWIGVMTTIAAAVAAYGLVERRKYLIGSYAAMASSLRRIVALDEAAPATVADLVATIEDLLESEHKAWLPQMLAHRAPAPASSPREGPARTEGS